MMRGRRRQTTGGTTFPPANAGGCAAADKLETSAGAHPSRNRIDLGAKLFTRQTYNVYRTNFETCPVMLSGQSGNCIG